MIERYPSHRKVGVCAAAALWAAATAFAQDPVAGRNDVTIRGEKQAVYHIPPTGTPLNHTVLYAPGIGGWKGWGITIAETMASWGYDVYGVDTKIYVDSFTGKTTLSEADVTRDMNELGQWASHSSGKPVTFVGWSEGAGIGVLAVSGPDNKKTFAGLITFGLEDANVMAWHWSENLTSLVKKPHEPTFLASGHMSKIAPLPLVMIQSTHDQYVGVDEAKKLFDEAHEPKRFELVQATNHRFDGNHDEFFEKLREGLQWVCQGK
jgi:dienelactone hydrolase